MKTLVCMAATVKLCDLYAVYEASWDLGIVIRCWAIQAQFFLFFFCLLFCGAFVIFWSVQFSRLGCIYQKVDGNFYILCELGFLNNFSIPCTLKCPCPILLLQEAPGPKKLRERMRNSYNLQVEASGCSNM